MTQFFFFKVIEVDTGTEACSWEDYAALLLHGPRQKLDDVLKELHGSHYVFILLRKCDTCKRDGSFVHKAG